MTLRQPCVTSPVVGRLVDFEYEFLHPLPCLQDHILLSEFTLILERRGRLECIVIPKLMRDSFRSARMSSRLRLSKKDCNSLVDINICLCVDIAGSSDILCRNGP